MGFVKSLFSGPPDAVQAQIDRPVTAEQANAAYGNTQQALAQQQAFLQAAQGQNGLQNQSQVFNQLGQVAQGVGFNPAQAQLANATGANVANQAALMAGQRGASQNAGLIARQAAMQGANIQQDAAGQAAALQANQSLNALGQQGQMAGQMVGNQLNAQQLYGQTALGQQGNLLGGVNSQNQAALGNAQSANQANQAGYSANMGLVGGLTGGLASALTQKKAHGGEIDPAPAPKGAASAFGQHIAMRRGGMVPGVAEAPGDDYANDTVPAMLSPGEVVVPRSIMQSEDPAKHAAAFVQAIMAKKGLKK